MHDRNITVKCTWTDTADAGGNDILYACSTEKNLAKQEEETDVPGIDQKKGRLSLSQGFIYSGIVLTSVGMIVSVYLMVKGTLWEGHLMEWMNIVVRLMHITFGIAWIGASFYFVFLENALNRTKGLRDELAGNLWAVHGGGFYYLEKYKVAPKEIPRIYIGSSMKLILPGFRVSVFCLWCIILMLPHY
jgi:hypothetical protein